MAGSSDEQEVPEFFSVFLHDRCTRSLHVSSAFGKRHIEWSNKTRRRARIRRPGTNKEWNVGLVEEDKEYYFTKGWNYFVKDNCLSDGEFMIFKYHGNSFFTVDIFGIHGCLKESVIEGHQSIADVNLVKIEHVDVDEQDTRKTYGRGRPIVEDALSDAVLAAKFYMKTHCDYPSFRVSINKWKHLLHVPLSFANTYMKGKDRRTIKLKVMNKIWSVNMLFYHVSASPYMCKLSKGISAFMEDNDIKDGDVCVFELVDLDLLHVAIFPN